MSFQSGETLLLRSANGADSFVPKSTWVITDEGCPDLTTLQDSEGYCTVYRGRTLQKICLSVVICEMSLQFFSREGRIFSHICIHKRRKQFPNEWRSFDWKIWGSFILFPPLWRWSLFWCWGDSSVLAWQAWNPSSMPKTRMKRLVY